MEKICYIIQICMVIVFIIAFISAIIGSRKKEYTEIFYHITSKDNKDDEWFRY